MYTLKDAVIDVIINEQLPNQKYLSEGTYKTLVKVLDGFIGINELWETIYDNYYGDAMRLLKEEMNNE